MTLTEAVTSGLHIAQARCGHSYYGSAKRVSQGIIGMCAEKDLLELTDTCKTIIPYIEISVSVFLCTDCFNKIHNHNNYFEKNPEPITLMVGEKLRNEFNVLLSEETIKNLKQWKAQKDTTSQT